MKGNRNFDFLTFDYNGFRYTIPVMSWLNPPTFPHGTTEQHMVIGNPALYERSPVEEGRQGFIQGYREVGGNEEALNKLLHSIMPKQAPPTDTLEEW